MSKPPHEIDGANVIFWSWSGETPFFVMNGGGQSIAIHGLAICEYKNTGAVYRFSCNKLWEVEGDSQQDSVEDAMKSPHGQYQIERINWFPYQE